MWVSSALPKGLVCNSFITNPSPLLGASFRLWESSYRCLPGLGFGCRARVIRGSLTWNALSLIRFFSSTDDYGESNWLGLHVGPQFCSFLLMHCGLYFKLGKVDIRLSHAWFCWIKKGIKVDLKWLHLHVSTMPCIYFSIDVDSVSTKRVTNWDCRLLWEQLSLNTTALLLQQIKTKVT